MLSAVSRPSNTQKTTLKGFKSKLASAGLLGLWPLQGLMKPLKAFDKAL